MLRTFAIGTALAILAQSAAAEEKIVYITENGFFPETLYVSDGDTVTFINDDDDAHKLYNEGNEWETTTVNTAQSATITVWQGMKNRYFSTNASHDSGVISFAAEPS